MSLNIMDYIVAIVTTTTIQISTELKEALKRRKLHVKETYEEIIWDLLEDQMELKEEILESIKEGIEEYAEGRYYSMEEVFGNFKGEK